jgi:hypothetical protein
MNNLAIIYKWPINDLSLMRVTELFTRNRGQLFHSTGDFLKIIYSNGRGFGWAGPKNEIEFLKND